MSKGQFNLQIISYIMSSSRDRSIPLSFKQVIPPSLHHPRAGVPDVGRRGFRCQAQGAEIRQRGKTEIGPEIRQRPLGRSALSKLYSYQQWYSINTN